MDVNIRNIVIAMSALFLTACSSLFTQNQVCDVDEGSVISGKGANLVGQVEYVDILPEGVRQKARIDTGAQTTSIDASNIVAFERDGKKWVKFSIKHRQTGKVLEFKKPVVRTALIKRHGAETVKRPVIKLKLAIGDVEKMVEVNLADRSKFEYPVLIGRNFLDAGIAVDVSRKYLMLDK